MTGIKNIVKKEMRELLTPGSIASILAIVILFCGIGGAASSIISETTNLPVIGIANFEDQTVHTESGDWNAYDSMKRFYIQNGIPEKDIDSYIIKMEMDGIAAQITESGAACALVLSDDFKKNIESEKAGKISPYYVYEPSGVLSTTISTATVQMIVSGLNADLSKKLIGDDESQKHIDFIISPINGGESTTYIEGTPHKNVTPAEISNALSSQTTFVPIIIMVIIMMVGSIVISSMGSEKENKTLETLLTLPIKRSVIVTGKIVAAALVGLIYGVAYMIGMGVYLNSMSSITTSSSVSLSDLGMSLDLADYALITISMFLAIICALGICMILGAFAKNFKSAQTMTMPISIIAIIPMFLTMFSGWYGGGVIIQTILFAIPFSHPMMATTALLNNDLTLVLGGMAYMAIFAVITIFITVKLYNSDLLITGIGQNKYVQKLKAAFSSKH